jgi:sortase A
LLGLALLGGSLFLLTQNEQEEAEAADAVADLLPQLVAEINDNVRQHNQTSEAPPVSESLTPDEAETAEQTDPTVQSETVPDVPEDPAVNEMTQTNIGGFGYIGFLSIPDLMLDLPVMAEWDYYRLRISPCRYSGSIRSDDLVIMAHNYTAHFGNLSKLSEGARITFTDMDGIQTVYEVAALDILSPYAVDEVLSGDYPLVLFTCTYGGRSRVTVYCDYADD